MKMRTPRHGDVLFALAALGVLAYGLAALVTVLDILGRRAGLPIEGVVDLVQLFVMAGAWLVMPYAFYTGAHVGVDFVVDKMPSALQRACRLLGSAIAVVLLGLMLWYGYTTFQQRIMFGDRSQELGIPIMWFWVPVLLGMVGSAVAAALTLLQGGKQEAVQ